MDKNNALNVRLREQSSTTWTLLYASYRKFFVEQKERDGTRNFKLVSTISRNTFTSGRVTALVLFDIDSSLHRLSQIIANSR